MQQQQELFHISGGDVPFIVSEVGTNRIALSLRDRWIHRLRREGRGCSPVSTDQHVVKHVWSTSTVFCILGRISSFARKCCFTVM